MKILRFLVVLIVLISLVGCYVGTGVVHTVGRGETLWRICYTYGVEVDEVADLNSIRDTTEIKAGQKLFIPGVRRAKKVVPNVIPASIRRNPEEKIVIEKGRFIWPVRGKITSRFGVRAGERHDGIDISAAPGTPIKAADDGKVVVVDRYRSYGKILILEHKNDYYTVYSHNRKNLVTIGDSVSKGDTIAIVGNTGNATGYHLHFEVRKGKKVLNPLFFLP
jgi:murein DD-endopeptidase MepM/ murein hydrolase activator NlpD